MVFDPHMDPIGECHNHSHYRFLTMVTILLLPFFEFDPDLDCGVLYIPMNLMLQSNTSILQAT